MSETEQSITPAAQPTRSMIDDVVNRMVGDIQDHQIVAARERVATLRQQYPEATSGELADMLIRRRCIDAGLIGLASTAPALIPGVGSTVAMTAGMLIDVQKTMKIQRGLTLEIAAIQNRTLSPIDRRNLIMLVTGVDSSNKLLVKTGTELATKFAARIGSRLAIKALPVVGMATSAGVNVVGTYLVGHRALAYFQLGPEAMADWHESLRALSGVDERKLASWLGETFSQFRHIAGEQGQRVINAFSYAGSTAGAFAYAQIGRITHRERK